MSGAAWLRERQVDLAVDRILEAAGRAIVERGMGAVTMTDVARQAGCSRGTLFRSFRTRDELHVAYVMHGAREIAEVRARPAMAAWFVPDQAGFTARLAGRAELFTALTAGLSTSPADDEAAERALVRLFVVPAVLEAGPGRSGAAAGR